MRSTVKILSFILCILLSLSLISCGQNGANDNKADETTASHEGHSHSTTDTIEKNPPKPATTVLTVKFVDALGKYVHGKSVVKIENGKNNWLAIANAKGEAKFTDAQFEKIGEDFTLVVTSVPDGFTCDYVGSNKLVINPGATEISIVLTKITPTTDSTQN